MKWIGFFFFLSNSALLCEKTTAHKINLSNWLRSRKSEKSPQLKPCKLSRTVTSLPGFSQKPLRAGLWAIISHLFVILESLIWQARRTLFFRDISREKYTIFPVKTCEVTWPAEDIFSVRGQKLTAERRKRVTTRELVLLWLWPRRSGIFCWGFGSLEGFRNRSPQLTLLQRYPTTSTSPCHSLKLDSQYFSLKYLFCISVS